MDDISDDEEPLGLEGLQTEHRRVDIMHYQLADKVVK